MDRWIQLYSEYKSTIKGTVCFVSWIAFGYWLYSFLPPCDGDPGACTIYVMQTDPGIAYAITPLIIIWLASGLTMLRMSSEKRL